VAGPQQVDLDPVDFGGQGIAPLLHETGPAARVSNLVRRAEDLDHGDECRGLGVADFEAGFLDLVVDQRDIVLIRDVGT
jgi:hypothetical protein